MAWEGGSAEPEPRRRGWLRPGVVIPLTLLLLAAVGGGAWAVIALSRRPGPEVGPAYRSAYSVVVTATNQRLARIDAERRAGNTAAVASDVGALSAAFRDFEAKMGAIDFRDQADLAAKVETDTASVVVDLNRLAASPQTANANRLDDDLAAWDADTQALADALDVALPVPAPLPTPH